MNHKCEGPNCPYCAQRKDNTDGVLVFWGIVAATLIFLGALSGFH